MEDSNYDPFEQTFLTPTVSSCLKHAWNEMWNNMGTLIALALVMIVLSIPNASMSWDLDSGWPGSFPSYFFPFFLGSTVYSLFIMQPVTYGFKYSTLKAARQESVQVADLFDGFKNYWNVILSSIFSGLLIGLGFILLIVPGIIIACKLAFVPFLVTDQKMTATEAISTSWRMTEGHTFTIFALGFVSIFIGLAGLLFFIVGIVPASIWIQTAFSAMYLSILSGEEDL